MSAEGIVRRFKFWFVELILKSAAGFSASDILDAAANGDVSFVTKGNDGLYEPVRPETCRTALYLKMDELFDPDLDSFEMTEEELKKHLPEGMTLERAMQLAAQANDAEVASIVAQERSKRASESPAASIQDQAKRESKSPSCLSESTSRRVMTLAKKYLNSSPHNVLAQIVSDGHNSNWNLVTLASHLSTKGLGLKEKTILNHLQGNKNDLPPVPLHLKKP